MAKLFENTYIPPYSNVRLVECHDHFQLVPVAEKRFFWGYGRAKASEARYGAEDGSSEPLWEDLGPDDEVWIIALGYRFDDERDVPIVMKYLRPSISEEEVIRKMEYMKGLYIESREEAVDLSRCYEATKEDLDYIDDNYPNYQARPTDPRKIDEQDLYDAASPGSRACGYKTASGRFKWPNRDPLDDLGFRINTKSTKSVVRFPLPYRNVYSGGVNFFL